MGTALAEGNPERGRAIVADRHVGLCLLCHSGPFPEERFQGNLAPNLSGVGARLSAAEIRARIADPRRANPQTIMPAYLSTDGLTRVAPSLRGKTLFTPQQLDDVVAFLVTLR
jgi:sulfur-oxidizing protein SoxX